MISPANEPNVPIEIKIHASMYFMSICPLAHTMVLKGKRHGREKERRISTVGEENAG